MTDQLSLFADPDDAVRSDVARYGAETFCSVDRSIRLHDRLDVNEPWNEWEYLRRRAAIEELERRDAAQTNP